MKKILMNLSMLVFVLTVGACRNNADHSSTEAGTSTHGTAEGMESSDPAQSPGNNRETSEINATGNAAATDSSASAAPNTNTSNQ